MGERVSWMPYMTNEYLTSVRQQPNSRQSENYVRHVESEFKKPYLYTDHQMSERLADPHEFPWGVGDLQWEEGGGMRSGLITPTTTVGGVRIIPPCTPQIVGISGNWLSCSCTDDCCVTITLSCPQGATSVDIDGGGFASDKGEHNIAEAESPSGDVSTFTKCGFSASDQININIDVNMSHQPMSGFGGAKQNVFARDVVSGETHKVGQADYGQGTISMSLGGAEQSCLGETPDGTCTGSCADCAQAPTIGYTDTQMQVSATQNLSASGGGGGPYRWQITTGSGTLAKPITNSGQANLYTAPSSNAGCTNNPTISVTDYCGNVKTLKLAINSNTFSGPVTATWQATGTKTCVFANCRCVVNYDTWKCDGTFYGVSGFCNTASTGTCPAGSCAGSCVPNPPEPGCTPLVDNRTGAQIAAGCCPKQVL